MSKKKRPMPFLRIIRSNQRMLYPAAPITVPPRIINPLETRCLLIVSKMLAVSLCFSSKRRNFNKVVASGALSRPRSIPTKRRIAWLSYNASSIASSENPKHRCAMYMRSILSRPIGGRPPPSPLG